MLRVELAISSVVAVVSSLVELPGVISTMSCYLEQFDPAWHGQTVQLSAGNLNPDYVTPHLAKMLTVPRAIKSADGALGVNPLQYFACENGGGFMTVLRAFRLVRLVKLLKGFPEIQKHLSILVGILNSVVALLGLIGLTLVIFAVLGMNIFGGKLEAEWDLELVELGASVFISVPIHRVHANGSAYFERVRRHGHVTAREPSSRRDTGGLPLWRVVDEWGSKIGRASCRERV